MGDPNRPWTSFEWEALLNKEQAARAAAEAKLKLAYHALKKIVADSEFVERDGLSHVLVSYLAWRGAADFVNKEDIERHNATR